MDLSSIDNFNSCSFSLAIKLIVSFFLRFFQLIQFVLTIVQWSRASEHNTSQLCLYFWRAFASFQLLLYSTAYFDFPNGIRKKLKALEISSKHIIYNAIRCFDLTQARIYVCVASFPECVAFFVCLKKYGDITRWMSTSNKTNHFSVTPLHHLQMSLQLLIKQIEWKFGHMGKSSRKKFCSVYIFMYQMRRRFFPIFQKF